MTGLLSSLSNMLFVCAHAHMIHGGPKGGLKWVPKGFTRSWKIAKFLGGKNENFRELGRYIAPEIVCPCERLG